LFWLGFLSCLWKNFFFPLKLLTRVFTPAHRFDCSLYCSVFKERAACRDVGYLTTPFSLCQIFFLKLFLQIFSEPPQK